MPGFLAPALIMGGASLLQGWLGARGARQQERMGREAMQRGLGYERSAMGQLDAGSRLLDRFSPEAATASQMRMAFGGSGTQEQRMMGMRRMGMSAANGQAMGSEMIRRGAMDMANFGRDAMQSNISFGVNARNALAGGYGALAQPHVQQGYGMRESAIANRTGSWQNAIGGMGQAGAGYLANNAWNDLYDQRQSAQNTFWTDILGGGQP